MKKRNIYFLILFLPIFWECSHRSQLIRQADIIESGKSTSHMSIDNLLMKIGAYCVYHPDDPQALFTYTRLLSKAGYNAAALRNAEKLVFRNPRNKEYRNLYIAQCILGYQQPILSGDEKNIPGKNGNEDLVGKIRIIDSIIVLNVQIRNEQSKSETYAKRGQQFLFLNELRAANWDFDKSLQLDPCNTLSLFNKSFTLFKIRSNPKALDYLVKYEQCLVIERKKPYPGVAKYRTMLTQLISLDSLIKTSDHPAPHLFNRANLYAKASELEFAIADIDEAIKLDNRNADFFAMRANINYHIGRQDQALSDIERAEQLGGNKNSPLSRLIREGNPKK